MVLLRGANGGRGHGEQLVNKRCCEGASHIQRRLALVKDYSYTVCRQNASDCDDHALSVVIAETIVGLPLYPRAHY